MTPRSATARPLLRGLQATPVKAAPLVFLLVAGGVGCYRATGESKLTTVAQQIPGSGGDRVAGMKATAGPGDYYLASDYVQMAVDGAVFGVSKGQFDAPSGGAILDVGGVALDTSFKRVSLPTDNLERLGPVVNQDPDLPLVFNQYQTSNTKDLVALTMQGYLLDPSHKLAGASWDASGRVKGLSVVHTITLGAKDSFFTIQTQIVNNSGTSLPILSIGDYLSQRGGGFRFVIPANQDAAGSPISTWGLDIPGSDFNNPMTTSVLASVVGLQGAEPSAADLDAHQSLGILPVTCDQVLVASDPQETLNQDRPKFPSRLVVGSLPAFLPLSGAGGTLSYQRRLYCLAGSSLTATYPVEARGVLNEMIRERGLMRGKQTGIVTFRTNRTADQLGYLPTEVRFERYTQSTASSDPSTDTDPTHWTLEWVGIPEPGEVPSYKVLNSTAALEFAYLPAEPDLGKPGSYLPYRIVVRSRQYSTTNTLVQVLSSAGAALPADLLRPDPGTPQNLSEALASEAAGRTSTGGSVTSPVFSQAQITVRRAGDVGVEPALTPARIVFQGLDASGAPDPALDPDAKRIRKSSSIFDPIVKSKTALTQPGAYQFSAGNELFGVNLLPSSPAVAFLNNGLYRLLISRGPLEPLVTSTIAADNSRSIPEYDFVFRHAGIPSGWTAFDAPGPTEATTGGMLPSEQLSSALADGVNVVSRTETDRFIDGGALHESFTYEFHISGDAATDASRIDLIGAQPFVIQSRSSDLAEGTFTGLFTPAPNAGLPFGGALPSNGWTPADFVGQSGGGFVIANRPRGPKGLFSSHPVAAGVPLGTGANGWWDDTDAIANGRRAGDFDAIELLRAEGCNPADPSAWFAEFKSVRADWFNLLNLQTPAKFTKGLGLSSGVYSLDTPVGLARTYLKIGSASLGQPQLGPVSGALKSGTAVASTGPLVDLTIGGQGLGGLASGASLPATLDLWFATWVPVDEIRVVVNGAVVQTLHLSDFVQDPADARHWTRSFTLPMGTYTGGKDGWVVVEAGVPLATSGAYLPNSPWNKVMKGIYPVAVTNPIFVDVDGGGYTAPL